MSFNIDDVEKSINFIFSMYPNHDMISMSKSQTYWLLKRVRELEEENKQIKHAYNERCDDMCIDIDRNNKELESQEYTCTECNIGISIKRLYETDDTPPKICCPYCGRPEYIYIKQ